MSRTVSKPLRGLFIGLDGATDDVIGPMMRQGRLPHLAGLRSHGAYGRLASQPGYSSPALWTSIESGYPPEENGVLGFPTALRSNLRRPRIHERLSKAGWKVGMCRMFCNWPPRENEVFVIPSFADVAGRAHPEWLKTLCKAKVLSGYGEKARFACKIAMAGLGLKPLLALVVAGLGERHRNEETSRSYFRIQNAQHWLYARLFGKLVRTHQPDYAALMIGLADAVGHWYWHYHEARNGIAPRRDTRRLGGVVEQAYAEIDRVIGELLSLTDERTTIVIVSDHGMKLVDREGSNMVVASALPKRLGLDSRVEAYFSGYVVYLGLPNEEGLSLVELLNEVQQTRLASTDRPVFDPCHIVKNRIRLGIARDVPYEPDSRVSTWDGREVRLGALVRREPRRHGDHGDGPDGIILLRAPGIQAGTTIRQATHYNVAPTVLALLRMPIPASLKGEPLRHVMQPELVDTISYTAAEVPSAPGPTRTLDAEDKAMLEERLRNLGYID